MKCNHLLPNNLGGRVSNRECLLQQNHKDYHLAKTNNGNYILWYSLDECFCNKVPCQCFGFLKIAEAEAQKLLK